MLRKAEVHSSRANAFRVVMVTVKYPSAVLALFMAAIESGSSLTSNYLNAHNGAVCGLYVR